MTDSFLPFSCLGNGADTPLSLSQLLTKSYQTSTPVETTQQLRVLEMALAARRRSAYLDEMRMMLLAQERQKMSSIGAPSASKAHNQRQHDDQHHPVQDSTTRAVAKCPPPVVTIPAPAPPTVHNIEENVPSSSSSTSSLPDDSQHNDLSDLTIVRVQRSTSCSPPAHPLRTPAEQTEANTVAVVSHCSDNQGTDCSVSSMSSSSLEDLQNNATPRKSAPPTPRPAPKPAAVVKKPSKSSSNKIAKQGKPAATNHVPKKRGRKPKTKQVGNEAVKQTRRTAANVTDDSASSDSSDLNGTTDQPIPSSPSLEGSGSKILKLLEIATVFDYIKGRENGSTKVADTNVKPCAKKMGVITTKKAVPASDKRKNGVADKSKSTRKPKPAKKKLTAKYTCKGTANISVPSPAARRKKTKGPGVTSKPTFRNTFAQKLMQSLLCAKNEEAVAWLPDGKSFVVVDPDLFVSDIMPLAFDQTCKYASFIRKLNRWGFVKMTSGTGTDCFCHELFQRDRPELCRKMQMLGDMDADKRRRTGLSGCKFTGLAPSLAGVEKFIKKKRERDAERAAAVYAIAAANIPTPRPTLC